VTVVAVCQFVFVVSYHVSKLYPVCPIYALWHSVHVSLYISDRVNLFGGGLCGVSSLPMVLFVRKAI
jgi:hypothetical protein